MDTNIETGSGQRAGRREWIGLAVLALPTVLLALDFSVLYLALPSLSADLGAGSVQQLWIMDIYGFMVAGFLITMGTLGDRIGRRKLLMIGAAAFGVASVLAAFSISAEMLIATRALMGIAGATLMPSTLALISNMFADARQRGVAIAVWMSSFMGGLAIGPLVGGVLLANFWWGSVFLMGVPVMALLLVAAPALLPEYRDQAAGKLDLMSAAMSLAAILPVIYGIKELAKNGWDVVPIVALVVGVAFGVLFVARQRGLDSPLLDLSLFSNRTFSGAVSIWLFTGALQGGIYFLISLYLQTVKGLTPLQAGLWLLPSTLVMILSIMLAPAIAQRVRPAYAIAGGLFIAAVGYVPLAILDSTSGLAVLVTGLVVGLLGIGVPSGLTPDLIVGSAPPEKAGSASSVQETSSEFGIALGVAVLGSIATAVYRGQLADAAPAGVPVEAADTARDSIAGAVTVVGQVPGPVGAELLASAREAFTSGMNLAAGISVVLLVILGAIAVVTLRHVPRSGEAQGDRADEAEGAPADAEATIGAGRNPK